MPPCTPHETERADQRGRSVLQAGRRWKVPPHRTQLDGPDPP
ncbi:MAG: hypothetical protein VX899_27650 [Myxococcota bacterium]|nr:hypothetical protein [Myxococcota bacterium]